MTYELWEQTTGNMLGDFESEAEARLLARDLFTNHYPGEFVLLSTDGQGKVRSSITGERLAQKSRLHSPTATG